jgi:S-DNA-T family DNA segregation ATPase FtsK/SpoIIIE
MTDIDQVFSSLKIDAKCERIVVQDNSIFYDIKLGDSCKISRFLNLSKEIEFRLKSPNPLYLKVIPEQGIIRIQNISKVLKSIDFLELEQSFSGFLPVTLGQDYFGKTLFTDLSKHPHTLVSGTTGSGKSYALHNFICSTLLQDNVDIYLSDPKGVEFIEYENLDSVKRIVYTYKDTLNVLDDLISIMSQRFLILRKYKINSLEQKPALFNKIFFVIDEIADLMLQDKLDKKFELSLTQLAQKCRAAGIYLMIATQRPSVDVVSGLIKANFPARIACKVSSKIDSKVILDDFGAENLLGQGDAIIKNYQFNLHRFKFPSISLNKVLEKIRRKKVNV